MDILKTPPERFHNLKDYPFRENYVRFGELNMHYINEGDGEVILALHGEPTWSYLYRNFIPEFKDFRFITPDLIGCGKSDKIKGWKNYSFSLHFKSLENFVKKLQLEDITLIVHDWGGLLGLSLLAKYPERFKRIIILNTFLPVGKSLSFKFKLWKLFARFHPSLPVEFIIQFGTYTKLPKDVKKAYSAPFPNKKYKSGIKAFPLLIPSSPMDEGAKELEQTRRMLSRWEKPSLILFSDKDMAYSGKEVFFDNLIPNSKMKHKIKISDASHFLQEDKPREICTHIRRFINNQL